MAVSKYQSTRETTNLARIAGIILGPCTDVLRDVLKKEILPSALSHKVKSFLANLPKFKKPSINKVQAQLVFSKDYSKFDITLLYFLLRNVCSIPPHANNWGNCPNPDDRSVSANIERIRMIRNEFCLRISLSNSEFEHKWKDIFQIVQDLEWYLGPSNVYQDSLMLLKTCGVDPDKEYAFLNQLQSIQTLESEITKRKEELKQTEISVSVLNVKVQELERYIGPSNEYQELLMELKTCSMDPNEKSSIIMKYQSLNNLQKEIEKLEDELEKNKISISSLNIKDIPWKKYEQITSETLKKLFNSFKVDFPADVPGCESFARKILEDDINKLVASIQSLSNQIVLTTQINAIKRDTPQVEACVFEVDVVDDEDRDGDKDKFCVFRKETSLNMLFDMEEDTRIRVILIRSESLPVVSSKLIVYKNFKHVINEKGFFLQHEYEEFDDVAKLIAYRVILSFCSSVESVINAFTADLSKSMADYFDKPLTADKIRTICSNVFDNTGYKPFGSTKRTRNWSSEVADLIQSKLSNDELQGADAWSEIKSACCKTVEDLKFILDGLEKFQANEPQIDQKEQIKEWFKADIFPDRFLLLEYPSIIKYLAGYRHGEEVVKVYLSSDDERAKSFFKKNCKVSPKTHFEFVNVEEMNVKGEDEEKKEYERKVPAVAESTKEDLMQIIRENGGKILAKYSNVIGIRVGQTKPYRITLCCLDRTIIPFGEQPLPESIAGNPCYVREDFFIFGTCPLNCTNDLPKPGCSIGVPEMQGAGCSIGVPEKKSAGCSTGVPEKNGAGCSIGVTAKHGAGSVGFFYESKKGSKYGSGFITAFHVAIENRYRSRYQDKLLSNCIWKKSEIKPTHNMVHPKCKNHNGEEHIVGEVVEAFFGNYKLSQTLSEGLDFAAVRTNSCRQGKKEILQFVKREKLGDREMVTKTGKTTQKTYGYLSDYVMIADVSIPGFIKKFKLPELYIVKDIDKNQRFFEKGDSGSGVFVVGEDQQEKVLGIGIAVSPPRREAYVCKIDKIVTNLDLTLVRYTEDKQKETSPNTENNLNGNTQNPSDWFSEFNSENI